MSCAFNVYLNFGYGGYSSFDLNEEEIGKRLDRKFWIDYIEAKLLQSSKKLTDILEKNIEIYSYVSQLNSVKGEIKLYVDFLEELYSGFDNNIFESKVIEGDYHYGKLYVLYRSLFDYRRTNAFAIKRMFYYNKNINENEEILELTNGNSKVIKTLSKEQIDKLNSLNFENTRLSIMKFDKNYTDFNKLHTELRINEDESSFIFNINDKDFKISRIVSPFPKDEMTSRDKGILIKEVGSSDFVYYENSVTNNDLCYVSINGVEYAGTAIYGDSLTLGLNKHLFNQNELPMYEILDDEYKNKLKELFYKEIKEK